MRIWINIHSPKISVKKIFDSNSFFDKLIEYVYNTVFCVIVLFINPKEIDFKMSTSPKYIYKYVNKEL